MKLGLKDVGLILILAVLWAAGGYIFGLVVETVGISYLPLKIIAASLNTIFGLLLFLNVTSDPTAERIFFKGPKSGESGLLAVGCLWFMPLSLIIFNLAMWFWAIILRIIFK